MKVIEVKDVSKKYRLFYDKGSTLKEKILFKNRNRYEDRWILKDVNLDIKKGETVGLIGENGSGKSTLLKLLTKIIYPNIGEIKINGKVSSLLELGAGFHPDMTGRENIYTNASIFGLTKNEIDKKISQIISFSELGENIDNPVRTYSSGMYMRLAFSVAINVDADILLIDEILAVGDASFQKKCFDKLKELKIKGTTIIIVSHDLGSLEKICSKIVWINKAKIQSIGDTKQIIYEYLQYMNSKVKARVEDYHNQERDEKIKHIANGNSSTYRKEVSERWGSREVEIINIAITDRNGENKHCFTCGENISIKIEYKKHKDEDNYVFGICIFNQEDIICYGTNTYIDGINIENIQTKGTIKFNIKELLLLEGKYYLDVAVHAENGRVYDYQKRRYMFEVISTLKDIGITRLNHKWSIL